GVPSTGTPAGSCRLRARSGGPWRSEARLSHAGPIGGLVSGILGAGGVHAFELRIGRAGAADGGRRRVTAAGVRGAAVVLGVRRRRPGIFALAGRFLRLVVAGRDVLRLRDIGPSDAPPSEQDEGDDERHECQWHANLHRSDSLYTCHGLPRITRSPCAAPSSASTTSAEPATGRPSSSSRDTPRLTPSGFSTTTS